MLPYIIATLVTVTMGGMYYIRRRREELADRQLQMFLEQLIWDPDDEKYVVDYKDEILPLPREERKLM